MDPVQEIKARLSIEELVGQYCQLTKKGRNFIALCPFHHDTHPSFLVSPDKGICYCFPCQKGGDIFTFYQQIEGVDFPQAIKELAERTGVILPETKPEAINKDEKERMRECLQAALVFYARTLQSTPSAMSYLAERGVTQMEIDLFQLGLAPDSFTATYEHLLKAGFSKTEIQAAGLGVQKELTDERMYDRFRHRLMFPIFDHQSRIIGFGGRMMPGPESANRTNDAKYLNSSESPLYRKSSVLYGIHLAQKAMRESKRVVLVEGYFDVLACRRVGVEDVVATCGTALTEEHVRLLKRSVDRIILCLDQDRAGRDAAERAFLLCSREGLQVEGIVLGQKDPADAALESQDILREKLTTSSRPYLTIVLEEVAASDVSTPAGRRSALERILPLLEAIVSSTERSHAIRDAARALSTTEATLLDDLRAFSAAPSQPRRTQTVTTTPAMPFSRAEIALGLLLVYPRNLRMIEEMILPEDPCAAALYQALLPHKDEQMISLDALDLPEEHRSRARILQLYCEDQGFSQWNDAVATRELQHNIRNANRDVLMKKQKEITERLMEAKKSGFSEQEAQLKTEYQHLLELSRRSR